MRYNPAAFRPIKDHTDLAAMIAEIRDLERREGTKYPSTIEGVIRLWEDDEIMNFREDGEFGEGATIMTMTDISEALSDERLAALILKYCQSYHYVDETSAFRELQSLRSGNGGEVRVKALVWQNHTGHSLYADTIFGAFFAYANGGWSSPERSYEDANANAADPLAAAQACCFAEVKTRILSALEVKP